MKKTILATALGIGVSFAPAYGQGSIIFNNYGATTDAIITWCPDLGGMPVDSSWTAGLWYSFGGSQVMDLGVRQAFNPLTPGYFQGPIVTIPGYVAGPITFQIYAFYGGSDYNSALRRGISAPFTLPSIATGIMPVGEFGPGLKPFLVGFPECIPEPGTIALVGLGLVSLLVFRRKDRTAKKD